MTKTKPGSSSSVEFRQRMAAVVVLIAGLLAAGVMISDPSSKTAFGIAAGVLGSLSVAVLGLIVNHYVIGETPTDIVRGTQRLDEGLRRLERALPLVEHSAKHGYLGVKPKIAYSSEEWLAVLEQAEDRLILVGHALDTWCRPDFRMAFERTIIRMVSTQKPVELLMLPVNGANTRIVGALRGQSYGERVATTLELLTRIRAKLDPADHGYLIVKTLHPNLPMPYMLVGHQDALITCSYPATSRSSNDMPTVKLDAAVQRAELCATTWSACSALTPTQSSGQPLRRRAHCGRHGGCCHGDASPRGPDAI